MSSGLIEEKVIIDFLATESKELIDAWNNYKEQKIETVSKKEKTLEKCKYIFVKGKEKGNRCTTAGNNNGYCGKHIKQIK